MLTQEQIDSYREHGYIGLENVLPADFVAELCRVTDDFVEQSRSVTEHTDVFDLEPGHTAEEPRLRRIKYPVKQHPVYDQAWRHPAILDRVEQLIGPGVRTNSTKLNIKAPEYGSAVEWHQDWAFYPQTNDDVLAVGIAMDDMMEVNGCLMVVPGSHKGPVLSHHENGRFVGAVTENLPRAEDAVPIELKTGGISIHHARTLHASAPNRSQRPRRLLLFEYCAIDAWPLVGSISFQDWDGYLESILRGEPTSRPRMAAVPVQVPWPPPERAGSIYEVQTTAKERPMSQAT
jgi:ectoine hydroxylase-related dioxygenase (phytanoyl-CoA dioxygenase family)